MSVNHYISDNNQKESDRKIIALCSVLALAIFTLDSFIPLGVAGGVPYVLVILVAFLSPRKYLPLYIAVFVSILTLIGIYSSPSGGEMWKVWFNRALALFAIWVTAAFVVHKAAIQEQSEKALSELKILHGTLPICSYCKKIRCFEGLWHQLELYIDKHSEAEFSHGICPECRKELKEELETIQHNLPRKS